MTSAGAPDRDHKLRFSFLFILRDHKFQKVIQFLQEFFPGTALHHIVLHRFFCSRVKPQFFHIVRIREEPHIKHEVCVRRDPVFEAEAQDRDKHAAVSVVSPVKILQLMAQLLCQKSAGVDDLVGLFFQESELFPLQLDPFLHAPGP